MAVINPNDKALLLRSFDDELTTEERSHLTKALQNSPALRKEQEELQSLREQLAALQARPPIGISEAVLKQLKPSTLGGNLAYLFPRVAAACIIILLVGLLNIYFSEGSLTLEAIIGVNDLSPEEAYSLIVTSSN